MQMFKRGGVKERWAGSVQDIVTVARLAATLLGKVASRDMSSEVWAHIDSHAYELRLEGLSELEAGLQSDADLELVRRISINVGSAEGGAAHIVTIFQHESPAAIYGVAGWDRTWVEGAATELNEALGRREQSFRWERWLRFDPIVAVLAISSVAMVAAVLSSVLADKASDEVFLVVGLVSGAGLLLYLLAARIIQRYTLTLELLAEGESTRWERERRRALTVLGSAALIVVTAAVYALAGKFVG